ncbi:hypothetical protein [Massilia pseudoviolaceinigra]|uniref:hypothetical protein n=1 Tax=Massilia pseudoviolaceinigra TaxID=3057165 RepID=UPI002796759E|nr:hypothetical protein [Massilia sp. CCM 9206]MDQ1924956.1 hypothetical protein [Massilia sp. CCM 9206]
MIAVAIAISSSTAFAAPVLHTSDFIGDSQRAGFNGFEALPNVGWNDIYATAYSEGGIDVNLVGDTRA